MAEIDRLLILMVEKDASDLHIKAGHPPYIRVYSNLVKLDYQPLSPKTTSELLMGIVPDSARNNLEQYHQTDFVYALPAVARFRTNIYRDQHGLSGAFRFIPNKIPSAESLSIPQAVVELTNTRQGLVLVTGPTGSGKSSTLAALIDKINSVRKDHIVTVEDPIEFVHESKSCLVTQRQVGVHVPSFSDALRACLREDPDVILVGEMRDLETISLALSAAETGHLVFATLHTNSASKTVDRIIDAFPSDQQNQVRMMISEALKAVVSQTLIRRMDGQGRVAAFEVLIGSPALANLIREGKTPQITSLMQTGKSQGMQLLDQALLDLVKQRKISTQDAMYQATDKRLFAPNLVGAKTSL